LRVVDDGPDLGATDLVKRVLDEALHVEPIEDDGRVLRRLRNCRDVRLRHVDRYRLEAVGTLRPQLSEEGFERVSILPLARPDHAAGDVVGHDRHVLVMLAVGQLIDAMCVSPSRRSPGRRRSTTRRTIAPTVGHATRIIVETTVLEASLAR